MPVKTCELCGRLLANWRHGQRYCQLPRTCQQVASKRRRQERENRLKAAGLWNRCQVCGKRASNAGAKYCGPVRQGLGMELTMRNDPPEEYMAEIAERALECKLAHFAERGCTYGGPD